VAPNLGSGYLELIVLDEEDVPTADLPDLDAKKPR
jgi:hypothetical protein